MKKITKLLMPITFVTASTAVVPFLTSCNDEEYDPYVILPVKHVDADGVAYHLFEFEIKDKGTIYERVDATCKRTNVSREGLNVEIVASVVSEDKEYLDILTKIVHEDSNGSLQGGDTVEFDLGLSCYLKEDDTNPDWTTESKGYRIRYLAESTADLFKIEQDGAKVSINGWATDVAEETKKERIANNNGILEFPSSITRISNKANLDMPDNCTTIKFRKDSTCNGIFGYRTDSGKEAAGAFDITQTWTVKNFIINPSMYFVGESNITCTDPKTGSTVWQIVFPEPAELKNITIDLTEWSANDIAKIATVKENPGAEETKNKWKWSFGAWQYYKLCENSVIKIKPGTRDIWFDYFGRGAGFKFFDKSTTEKKWWRIEEIE